MVSVAVQAAGEAGDSRAARSAAAGGVWISETQWFYALDGAGDTENAGAFFKDMAAAEEAAAADGDEAPLASVRVFDGKDRAAGGVTGR